MIDRIPFLPPCFYRVQKLFQPVQNRPYATTIDPGKIVNLCLRQRFLGNGQYPQNRSHDPQLKKTVKDMALGEVSDLIATPSGIKIIKLLEKQQKGVKTLEEARDAIYGELYLEEVNKQYASWIKELRKKAYTKITF